MANPFADVYYEGVKAGVAYWDECAKAAGVSTDNKEKIAHALEAQAETSG